MEKNKYVGKKAKIEAIKRFSGVELSPTLTTNDVNEYIAQNLFNTSDWKAYHKVFQSVCDEKVNISMDIEIAESESLFVDGIWFVVQHLVIEKDMPSIAAEIVSEARLSIADCKAAQARSGSHKEGMNRFIKVDLANLL